VGPGGQARPSPPRSREQLTPGIHADVTGLEMAMGISPSGVIFPYPSPRGKKIPVPVPVNFDGGEISPSPSPLGDFFPTGFPVPA
jgi:hypothetical protein